MRRLVIQESAQVIKALTTVLLSSNFYQWARQEIQSTLVMPGQLATLLKVMTDLA